MRRREGKVISTQMFTFSRLPLKAMEKNENSIKVDCRAKHQPTNANRKFLFSIRSNSKGYDLNRNFPDYFKQNTKRTQPETDAVKDWISKIQFLLSGSLHGGALV